MPTHKRKPTDDDTPPPVLNIHLKSAILASPLKTSRGVARAAQMDETRLSHIVRGRHTPTKKERERLARVLHTTVAKLFPDLPNVTVRAMAQERRATA